MNKTLVRIVIMFLLIVSVIAIVVTATVPAEAPTTSSTTTSTVATESLETEPSLNIVPIYYDDIVYVEPLAYWDADNYIEANLFYISMIQEAIDSGVYSEQAVVEMNGEIARLLTINEQYEADKMQFAQWDAEHYYASQVWQYYRWRGFSPEVVAGIIGNMMVETSGGTLDLKPRIYNPSRGYYGLCQWSLYYKPFMADTDFDYQLSYLLEDMSVEFKNFGFCYKKGFTYDDFLELETPEDAALAFAKVYERCASGTYGWRKTCARDAYDYFMG